MQRSTALEVRGAAGAIAGALLAPLTSTVAWLRHSRTFHPSGVLCRAAVTSTPARPELEPLAARAAGAALVRLSSALWKRAELPDVLGCAVRLTRDPLSIRPNPEDQDLLFATIRRPWTMAFSPFTTQHHDFLSNRYYAVSPFRVPELGRGELALVPRRGSSVGTSRRARLEDAIGRGAVFTLCWSPYRRPWRAFDDRSLLPFAELRLLEIVALDQEELRFDPFRNGRGIHPVGFVHGLRRATYAGSQAARPAHSASEPLGAPALER